MLIALVLVNLVEPGVKDGQPVRRHARADRRRGDSHRRASRARADTSVLDTIKGIVPANIVEAAANTKMLGLVLFSVLFGFFLARIAQPHQGHGVRLLAGHLPRS